jgi:hypothetical protein
MSILDTLLPKPLDGATSKGFSGLIAGIFSLVGGLLVAPFIFMAIGGLVGFIVSAGIAWAAFKMAPVFGIMIGNQTLKMIKWESRRNPVETLQSLYNKAQAQIQADEAMANEFNQQVEAQRPIVADLVKNYPEDAAPFVAHLRSMAETRELVYNAIAEAKDGLVEFARQIKRADSIWKATQSSNKLSAFAGRIGKTEAIAKIQQDEAILAIQNRMTSSFANLDHMKRMMADAARNKAATASNNASLGGNSKPAIPQSQPTLLESMDNKIYSVQPQTQAVRK